MHLVRSCSSVRIALTVLLGLFAGVGAAHASHWLVVAAGGGDFTSIQPALDAGGRDSVIVTGGSYPETLRFTPSTPEVVVYGIGGAALTHVGGVATTAYSYSPRWRVSGLDFTGPVVLGGPTSTSSSVRFQACRFLKSVYSRTLDTGGNFADCDFYGATSFIYYGNGGAFTNLRFHSAPVYILTSATGTVVMSQCTFEGPADTLVTAQASTGNNPVAFFDCRFQTATRGIVFLASVDNRNEVQRCLFTDLDAAAIHYEPGDHFFYRSSFEDMGIDILDSRFERCGQAVRWLTPKTSPIRMDRDTIRACADVGIEVTPVTFLAHGTPCFNRLVVEGGLTHGLLARLSGSLSNLWIAESRFTGNGGDGVRILTENPPVSNFPSRVTSSTSSHNAGDGFHVENTAITLQGNVALANGGDGIDFRSIWVSPYQGDSVIFNTVARNGGDGMKVTRSAGLSGLAQVVRSNIAALNAGVGIRAPLENGMSIAFNDAWRNYLSHCVGPTSPTDSNLVADPRFCDLTTGDVGLQADSPCGPTGVYAAMGARPVSCSSTASVMDVHRPAGLALSPNPALGAVNFSAPAERGGTLTLFDPQGREILRRSLRPGESMRWSGSGARGSIRSGVYLARWESHGETHLSRLVWLR